MKKIFTFYFIFLTSAIFAQTREFRGVVVDKNRQPIDLFTIVVAEKSHPEKQLYGEICHEGKYIFSLKTNGNEECLIYSLGYEDMKIPIKVLRDTIIMKSSTLEIKDAIVSGRRKVESKMTPQGGVLYDVQNTALSNMSTSTMLLNFIPGVKTSDQGNIKILGKNGNVVVYLNGLKLINNDKLLTIRSEDIKSIEVIRNPSAKYKGASSVLLIKTKNTQDGFGGRIKNWYIIGEGYEKVNPNADFNFTKSKISVNLAYSYNYNKSKDKSYEIKKINEDIIPNNWALQNENISDNKNNNHWYYGQIKYDITDNHFLSLEYSGNAVNNNRNSNSEENILENIDETIYNETILLDNDYSNISNQFHLFYKGKITKTFDIEFNADYSDRTRKDINKNNWSIYDLETEQTKENIFTQNTKNSGSAITCELMLSNTIKDKHVITYGSDFSYLKDNTSSNIKQQSSEYELKSKFVNAYVDYSFTPTDKWSLNAGLKYLYNNFSDKKNPEKISNNFTPNFSANYYNTTKKMGFNFNIEYKSYPQTAKWLDDTTITYISPYHISTGNSNLSTGKSIHTSISFNYKDLQIGFFSQNIINTIAELDIVKIQDNGKPLFVNMPVELEKPFSDYSLYASYHKTINFWTYTIYGNTKYTRCDVEQSKNNFELFDGFTYNLSMSNKFELPKNFYIYINGYYETKGQMFISNTSASYGLDIYIEKLFFNKKLDVFIKAGDLFSSKFNTSDIKAYGINSFFRNRNYGQNRFNCSLYVSWKFNKYKKTRKAKNNEYINMLK
ncbi:MAG: outer membrane beta-barrel protein [Bacteroidetes bacterium]|nr:outer membrane beta-barrel protein [Bacteroidota bacterium]